MTETGGTTGRHRTGGSDGATHEAYSFACMKCGYGWEQTYEIRHHTGADGKPFVTYHTNDERVPSPLTDPRCANCEGRVLRIMRSGRVALADDAVERR
ncbi:hypothetical protein [Streptomyces sp. JJ36]|uniref:hypothetical protein n=1 Tax=Streptomyces sp. JJ36 TaxID=2736645 RepID=UPI001F41DCD1|nr:hypothetical protein [Streptomyces sp. JJ36]MCF6522261.1 hypothetical protein [Streptomyces sp. JJ36]